jgi:hypothetical protein
VFAANSGPSTSTTAVDVNNTPAIEAPAADPAATTPMTEAAPADTAPVVEPAPADPAAAPADAAPAVEPAVEAPAAQ